MVVITDITITADQFALGRLLDEYPTSPSNSNASFRSERE